MKTEFRVACIGGFTFSAFCSDDYEPSKIWTAALKEKRIFIEFQCGATFITVRTDSIIAIEEFIK